jgi:hypothetical protein
MRAKSYHFHHLLSASRLNPQRVKIPDPSRELYEESSIEQI